MGNRSESMGYGIVLQSFLYNTLFSRFNIVQKGSKLKNQSCSLQNTA